MLLNTITSHANSELGCELEEVDKRGYENSGGFGRKKVKDYLFHDWIKFEGFKIIFFLKQQIFPSHFFYICGVLNTGY